MKPVDDIRPFGATREIFVFERREDRILTLNRSTGPTRAADIGRTSLDHSLAILDMHT